MLTVHAVDDAVGEWVRDAEQFMERFIDSEGSHKIKGSVDHSSSSRGGKRAEQRRSSGGCDSMVLHLVIY